MKMGPARRGLGAVHGLTVRMILFESLYNATQRGAGVKLPLGYLGAVPSNVASAGSSTFAQQSTKQIGPLKRMLFLFDSNEALVIVGRSLRAHLMVARKMQSKHAFEVSSVQHGVNGRTKKIASCWKCVLSAPAGGKLLPLCYQSDQKMVSSFDLSSLHLARLHRRSLLVWNLYLYRHYHLCFTLQPHTFHPTISTILSVHACGTTLHLPRSHKQHRLLQRNVRQKRRAPQGQLCQPNLKG
mmetsp:Transcript_17110/g.33507  ORF Transcript_17110/g.33507 Transcript_17110/m.33507 type:complete len:241 (+) Transcript_17110:906-1628(+)